MTTHTKIFKHPEVVCDRIVYETRRMRWICHCSFFVTTLLIAGVFNLQHIHAPEEGLSILGLRQQQDLLDPVQQLLADGCHLTRETDQLIRNAADGPLARYVKGVGVLMYLC